MSKRNNWKKGKGVKLLAIFFLSKLREFEEKELQKQFNVGDYSYNDILIKESSKPSFSFSKFTNPKSHYKKKSNDIMLFTHSDSNERNVNLIYLTLLKFKGLIRYMNFQDLINDDIRKISCFIKHKFCSKGQYLFRQYESSDAMYGVINGTVDIRLVSDIEYTKKFHNALIKGEDDINYIECEYPQEFFMSDLEEESEDSDNSYSENYSGESSSVERNNNFIKDHIIQKLNKQDSVQSNINKQELNNQNNDEIINNNQSNDNISIQNPNFLTIQNQSKDTDNKKTTNSKSIISITEDYIDEMTDIGIKIELKKKIKTFKLKDIYKKRKFKTLIKKSESNISKKLSHNSLKSKHKKIIKAIKNHQTPDSNMSKEELEKFILDFEIPRAQLSEGMCFGEWGILYNIPRTTSIYCSTNTDLFYLKKKHFDKILSHKFIASDMKKIKFILSRFPSLKKNYKMGKMLTKILPVFVDKGDIIYTPFDKADFLYIVYKGECAFYRPLVEMNCKEDYILKFDKLQILIRLSPGGIAGLESCIQYNKYSYCLMVTKPNTIIYKVDLNFILIHYHDFREDLLPMYKAQKILFENTILNIEETLINNSLKNIILREKQKKFEEELHKKRLKPASSLLQSINLNVDIKNLHPNYKKPKKKKYYKFSTVVDVERNSNFPKVITPSRLLERLKSNISNKNNKTDNTNEENDNQDFIFIPNKRTSVFNLRNKPKFDGSNKNTLDLTEISDSQDEIRFTNRTNESKFFRKKLGIKKQKIITRNRGLYSTEDTFDKEITNSINSNYSDKSGVKYYKSGIFDLPFVGNIN